MKQTKDRTSLKASPQTFPPILSTTSSRRKREMPEINSYHQLCRAVMLGASEAISSASSTCRHWRWQQGKKKVKALSTKQQLNAKWQCLPLLATLGSKSWDYSRTEACFRVPNCSLQDRRLSSGSYLNPFLLAVFLVPLSFAILCCFLSPAFPACAARPFSSGSWWPSTGGQAVTTALLQTCNYVCSQKLSRSLEMPLLKAKTTLTSATWSNSKPLHQTLHSSLGAFHIHPNPLSLDLSACLRLLF